MNRICADVLANKGLQWSIALVLFRQAVPSGTIRRVFNQL